jgi:Bacterial Ig domain/Bacterial Ig-like domain
VPDGGLQVSVDGGAAETVTFDANRNFTFTPSVTTDGQHVVTFSAGSDFNPVQFTYTLDTAVPTIQITSPATGQTFTANPQITGQATDAQGVTALEATVDAGPAQAVTVDGQGGFTFTPTLPTDGSADGQHTVAFVAEDAAGNQSIQAVLTFTLDTTAPALVINSPVGGSALTTSPTIVGTATDNLALSGLTVTVNGGPEQSVTVDGQGNFSFNPNLPIDGTADAGYQFVFTARDAGGNEKTVTHFLVLDTTRPVATVTSPPDGQTFASNPTINVSATDNISTASADVFVDGVFVQEVLYPTNTGFSFTTSFATDGSANGPHTVTIIAKDVAVNQSVPVDFHFTLQAP